MLNEESPIEDWLLQTLHRPGDVNVDTTTRRGNSAEIKREEERKTTTNVQENARERKVIEKILTETEGLPMTGASRRVSPLG